MFTGIVTDIATITSIRDFDGLRTITLSLIPEFCESLTIGASVAVDGVCLTVSKIHDHEHVDFDIMLQSLRTTTLAEIKIGAHVNVERAAKEGAEVGGHILSGHVDCRGKIIDIQKPPNNWMIRFEVEPEWMRYIFSKGFLAINGASLTVSDIDVQKYPFTDVDNREIRPSAERPRSSAEGQCPTEKLVSEVNGYTQKNSFDVWLIPETLRRTTFSEKNVGDFVNIEIERSTQIVVDAVRTAVEEQMRLLLPNLSTVHQLKLENELEETMKLRTAALLPRIMNNRENHKEHANCFCHGQPLPQNNPSQKDST